MAQDGKHQAVCKYQVDGDAGAAVELQEELAQPAVRQISSLSGICGCICIFSARRVEESDKDVLYRQMRADNRRKVTAQRHLQDRS